MSIEVRYYTKSGNSKKIADAIAKTAGVEAQTVLVAVPKETDILFLGGSIYMNGYDDELINFAKNLDPSIKKVALFTTSGFKKTNGEQIKKVLSAKNIQVVEDSFYCKGAFKAFGKGRPNEEDIRSAKQFAKKNLKKVTK